MLMFVPSCWSMIRTLRGMLGGVMEILEMVLITSAFVSGFAMPFFPSPKQIEGPQSAVWTFATALGIYVLFLSICTTLDQFMILLPVSLTAMAIGAGAGAGIRKEEQTKIEGTRRIGLGA